LVQASAAPLVAGTDVILANVIRYNNAQRASRDGEAAQIKSIAAVTMLSASMPWWR
jgi:hypothetical protein